MALILHLLRASDAARARASREPYLPATFASDGFVHCTAGDDSLLAVANAFYRQRSEVMVAWTIDTTRIGSEVRWEAPQPPDGSAPADPAARFPHVYGPIPLDAVVATRVLRRDASGAFTGYEPAR